MRRRGINPYSSVLLRQFTGNPGRFLAIMVIAALGVAFFAGLRVSGPYMRAAANAYYGGQAFMDARVISPLGLSDKDIDAMRAIKGVAVQPGYTAELSARMSGRLWNLHVMSMPEDTAGMINRPELISGRMPRRSGECVIDLLLANAMEQGDGAVANRLELFIDGEDEEDEDGLGDIVTTARYSIVGVVDSPLYKHMSRGASGAKYYIYIPLKDFAFDVYTEAAIAVSKSDELSHYSDAYNDYVDGYIDALKAAGAVRAPLRYKEVLDEQQVKLDDARRALSDAERSLEGAAIGLTEAREQLTGGERAYNAALNNYVEAMSGARASLDIKRQDLSDAQNAVYGALTDIDQGYMAAEGGLAALDAAQRQLDEGAAALAQLAEQRSALASQLYATDGRSPMYAILAEQLALLDAALEENTAALEDARTRYDEALVAYRSNIAILDAGRAQLDASGRALDAGRGALDDGWYALDAARAEGMLKLQNAWEELRRAQDALIAGEAAYAAQQAVADDTFPDARDKIDDAQDALDALEEPEWIVSGADGNADYAEYRDNCDRIEAISGVFPLIFFLVAALVTLTNMTRTVEDERPLIATLTALGYSNARILLKYILFAAVSSALGSAMGLSIGFILMPLVIFNAYGIMYAFPAIAPQFNGYYTVISTLLAMACSVIPAVLVCIKELLTTPASLMLPRAPKPGKRIWLEHMGVVWRALSFTQKVTARNLFRYKSRMIMTVVGVAGCTCLLLVGFGLRDSIQNLVTLQFTEIRKYDADVGIREKGHNYEDVKTKLNELDAVASRTFAYVKQYDALSNGKKVSVSLTVPMEPQRINGYIALRERGGGDLDPAVMDGGAIITEKLSSLLHVAVGDTIQVGEEGAYRTLPIAAISENYALHYVYISPSFYAAVFGEEAAPNWAMCKLRPIDHFEEERVRSELTKNGAVYVGFNRSIRDSFEISMKALDYVVWVLIVSAAALACVVLFSLTIINIDERKRELATITVLGFYDGEVASYVYREILLLTLMGAALGLGLGVLLHRFVIVTAEIDMVMFSREIKPLSYALSVAVTVAFGVLVDALMLPTLRRIDMVESLKSVE